MKKKMNAKELREKRNSERKETYKDKAPKNPAEVQQAEKFTKSVVKTNVPYEHEITEPNGDVIECKNHTIHFYQIICFPAPTNEEVWHGRRQKFILGKYTDEVMRDRAFESIKKSASEKHEVTDSKNGFYVRGKDANFNDFACEVIPSDYETEVDSLDHDRISFCLNIEV